MQTTQTFYGSNDMVSMFPNLISPRAWAPELFTFGGRSPDLEYWERVYQRLPEDAQLRGLHYSRESSHDVKQESDVEPIEDVPRGKVHSSSSKLSPETMTCVRHPEWQSEDTQLQEPISRVRHKSSASIKHPGVQPIIVPKTFGLFVNGKFLGSFGGNDHVELVPIENSNSNFHEGSPVVQGAEEAFKLFNGRLATDSRPSHPSVDIEAKVKRRDTAQGPLQNNTLEASTPTRPITRGLVKQQLAENDKAKKAERRVTRAAARFVETANEKNHQQRGAKAKKTGPAMRQRKREPQQTARQRVATANAASRHVSRASSTWQKLCRGEVAAAFVLVEREKVELSVAQPSASLR